MLLFNCLTLVFIIVSYLVFSNCSSVCEPFYISIIYIAPQQIKCNIYSYKKYSLFLVRKCLILQYLSFIFNHDIRECHDKISFIYESI